MPHLSCCLPVPGPGSVTVGLLATQVEFLEHAWLVLSCIDLILKLLLHHGVELMLAWVATNSDCLCFSKAMLDIEREIPRCPSLPGQRWCHRDKPGGRAGGGRARWSGGKPWLFAKKCTTITQLFSSTFHSSFFLSRLILTELESQERSYVESMRILVHDYLEPLEQAGPRVSSCELVFLIFFSF